jgi:EmrB/QacA subfamily drug resistance transporter
MKRSAWFVFAVVSLCTVQSSLSLSIMNVAFPELSASFDDVPRTTLQWVVTGYTVVAAGLLVIAGVVGDRYGGKRVLLLGAAVFGTASLACALAPSFELLLVGRCVQAVGSALITPCGAALVVRAFPDSMRSTAIALWAAVGSVAAALGPSVGGILVDAGGWRWAFWVNVPFSLLGVVLGWVFLEESNERREQPIPDPLGALGIMVSVGALVLAISQSAQWGWSDPAVWALLALSAVVGASVVGRSRRERHPILDLSLFEHDTFRWANVGSITFGVGFFSMFFGYVLFLRDVWDESTRAAGLLLTPVPAIGALLSPFAGRVADRRGERAPMMLGCGVFALGGAWLALFAGDEPRILSVWMPAAVLIGFGAAIAWPAVFGSVMVAIPPEKYAAATGINQTVQRIASAVGVALAVTLLGTAADPDAALFRRLFVLTAVCGVLGLATGTRLRRIPRTRERAGLRAGPVAPDRPVGVVER